MNRKTLVNNWSEATPKYIEYPKGVYMQRGFVYKYPPGRRLEILGRQITDDCVTPWCHATIDSLLRYSIKYTNREPVRILLRGYGLGISPNHLVGQLSKRKAHALIHIIELNQNLALIARKWAFKKSYTTHRIDLKIHQGDPFEVTQRLVDLKQKFDIVLSNTYPLNDKEKGKSDILDLGNLKKLLTPNGRFSSFMYDPSQKESLKEEQEKIIKQHFKTFDITYVPIFPHPDYKYLFYKGKPVTQLPVIICSNPIL